MALALDVALNKTVVSDASNLKPGDQVTYRIDAGNIGQGKAPDLKVKEAFPAGTTFVSAETHKCASGYTTGLPQGSRSEMTGWESTTVEVLFAVTLKVTSEPGDARLPLMVDLAL